MIVIGRRHIRNSRKDGRILFLTILFFLFGLVIILKLFDLQVIRGNFFQALASEQHEIYQKLFPKRGSIYVREKGELYSIVTNKDYYLVYADSTKISNADKTLNSLVSVLELTSKEKQDIFTKLNKEDDPYEPIKHKVSAEKVEELKKLNLAGISYSIETFRFYPEKDFGGQVLGFIGFIDDQRQGQYGLEGYFNQDLVGSQGSMRSIKDALGSLITIGERSVQKAVDGDDLVLTIDRVVQVKVCEIIKKAVEFNVADGGTGIVMNPKTGAILAMCSQPNFDPENYSQVEDINVFNNPAIFYPYEPGSVFKIVTMAAGIDLELVTPESTYEDTGEVKIIGHKPIRNSDLQAYGIQTMTQVLEKSLNTGAIFVVDKIGRDNFRKYVDSFGLGKITGITLDKEVAGNISSLNKRGEIYTITASFGQGITVTPLQLLNVLTPIVNGGKLIKPYIVDEIIKADGTRLKTQPEVVNQVITSKTATLINGMLVSVVENGWGKKAKVNGYYVAGKTGTAQVANPQGGYGDQTIHTFIGYTPVNEPKFAILVKLDYPKRVRFASDSTTPVFGQIAEFLLNYYQIPPER